MCVASPATCSKRGEVCKQVLAIVAIEAQEFILWGGISTTKEHFSQDRHGKG